MSKSKISIPGAIAAVLFLLFIIFSGTIVRTCSNTMIHNQDADYIISIEELKKEFSASPTDAEDKYLDQLIELEGYVYAFKHVNNRVRYNHMDLKISADASMNEGMINYDSTMVVKFENIHNDSFFEDMYEENFTHIRYNYVFIEPIKVKIRAELEDVEFENGQIILTFEDGILVEEPKLNK